MSVSRGVSIVIPTHNRIDNLSRLLDSINKQDYPVSQIEIIVIDNLSSDDTKKVVSLNYPKVKLYSDNENHYCGGSRNIGLDQAQYDLVFFIDDDNILDKSCVSTLVKAFENDPKLGVAGPLMLWNSRPTEIWCAAGRMNFLGICHHYLSGQSKDVAQKSAYINADYFPNAYMVRKELKGRVIHHDIVNFPHNWVEQDYCLAVQAEGFKIGCITSAIVYHDVNYSGYVITRISKDKTYDQARSRILFRKKHLNQLSKWIFFGLIVLPVSTVAYIIQFLKLGTDKTIPLWLAYWRGTMAGLRTPITLLKKVS